MQRFLYTLCLLILLPVALYSAVYHFSLGGDDISGDGSINNPYKTITFLNLNQHLLNDGDIVKFQCGSYWVGQPLDIDLNGTKNITYTSYSSGPKPRVIMTNTSSSVLKIENQDGLLTFENLEFYGGKHVVEIRDTGSKDYGKIVFNSCYFHDPDTLDCVNITKRSYVEFYGCHISGAKRDGISIAGNFTEPITWYSFVACQDIKIVNCTIEANDANGVLITGHSSYISNNQFINNARIFNLHHHHLYTIGDNVIVENNDFTYCSGGAAIRGDGSNCIIRYNTAKDNGAGGFKWGSDIPGTRTNTKVYYNVIELSNDMSSPAHEQIFGIYFNGRLASFSNMHIYNNTIICPEYKNGSYFVGIFIDKCFFTTVRNNIIVKPSYAIAVFEQGKPGFSSNNNCFDAYGDCFMWGTYSMTYTDWKTFGHDGASVKADPQLNNNHTLQSTSPAIDLGVNVGLSQDILGNAVPSGMYPDAGAFEYQQ